MHTGISHLVFAYSAFVAVGVGAMLLALGIRDSLRWVASVEPHQRPVTAIWAILGVVIGVILGIGAYLVGLGAYGGYFVIALAAWYSIWIMNEGVNK